MKQAFLKRKDMKTLIAAVIATTLLTISGAAQAADPVALVKQFKADCLACHAVEKKLVGPSWNEVAAMYKGDKTAAAILKNKVIMGGKGNWNKITGGMSMTPHPTKPSADQIQQIVAVILAP
jgi:cytochrome c